MKKWRASFFLFFILGLVIAGCSTTSEQLSRIDVQEVKTNGSYAEEVIITDKDKLESVETIFKQVKWDRNTIRKVLEKELVK